MLSALLSRELSSVDALARRRTSRLSLASDFSCLERGDDFRVVRSPLSGNAVPPFSSTFSRRALLGEAVAVSDEEGFVSLFDTSAGAVSNAVHAGEENTIRLALIGCGSINFPHANVG